MTENLPGSIAVIGATGQQGGAVARALLDHGARVRALVRNPDADKAHQLAEAGAEIVRADLADPSSVRAALTGTDTLFAMTTFAEDGPAAEVEQGNTIADAADRAGVTRIVYNSVGGADRATGIPHFESKWAIEERLRALSAALTVIRPVFFMDNLVHGVLAPAGGGEQVLRFPLLPGVPLQMIAVADIGAITAAAILDPDLVPTGRLEIGGDELTAEQIADTITAVTGTTTRFEPIDIGSVPDDDQRAMFEWFTHLPAYRADFASSTTISPKIEKFATFAARSF